MSITFDDITNGQRLAGVVADGDVTVVALERNGDTSATLAYRTADGKLDERILTVDDLAGISQVSDRRWTFEAGFAGRVVRDRPPATLRPDSRGERQGPRRGDPRLRRDVPGPTGRVPLGCV